MCSAIERLSFNLITVNFGLSIRIKGAMCNVFALK